ncbi:SAM hydrolase/SAM-dependent halogenase family protein [Marinivivus vitaminiproducens]|uniref:SAM hydrolase/SAM-dependent halogenase family protein n=1 Tax=Marinivivus vitaminiproducens TaxID=3035935 RepID=UPI00279C6C7B|nr:SAM-dependent chlorinase/fluorinase [Geminicoccaceae bacterium SCSIO 64248]
MSLIVLATDFGLEGPYTGQMKAVLAARAPGVPVVDLFADLPPFRARSAAYLLAAYAPVFGPEAVFLAVVDPGVGTDRAAVVVEADGQRFVGPDNGLFQLVWRRAAKRHVWRLPGSGHTLSASFHGRDLFAPVAADLAAGRPLKAAPGALEVGRDWPDDLPEIVYADRYGNAMTGLRAAALGHGDRLSVGGHELGWARVFGEVPVGRGFWYANANGLVEVAVNQGRAVDVLGLAVGQEVAVRRG